MREFPISTSQPLKILIVLTHGLSDANEKPYAIKKYDTDLTNVKLADLYYKYFVVLVSFQLPILFLYIIIWSYVTSWNPEAGTRCANTPIQ